MKNKRIDSFFKSDKREATHEDENRTNSTLPDIQKHDTNDLIIQSQEPFIRFKELYVRSFILILWNVIQENIFKYGNIQ